MLRIHEVEHKVSGRDTRGIRRRMAWQSVARVNRKVKADLSWLTGYPVTGAVPTWEQIPWGTSGRPVQRQVMFEDLRRARSTIQALQRCRLSQSGPHVDFTPSWLHRLTWLLHRFPTTDGYRGCDWIELLADAPLPGDWKRQFQRRVHQYPEFTSLLTAIGYLELTNPQGPQDDLLLWIDRFAASLQRLLDCHSGFDMAIRLVALRHELPEDWESTIQSWICAPCCAQLPLPLADYVAYLHNTYLALAKGEQLPASGPSQHSDWNKTWVKTLNAILDQEPCQRRISLRLLSLLIPSDLSAHGKRIQQQIKNYRLAIESRRHLPGIIDRNVAKSAPTLPSEFDASMECMTRVAWLLEQIAHDRIGIHVAADYVAIAEAIPLVHRHVGLPLLRIWERQRRSPRTKAVSAGAISLLADMARRLGLPQNLINHWNHVITTVDGDEFLSDAVLSFDSHVVKKSLQLLETLSYADQLEIAPATLNWLTEIAYAIHTTRSARSSSQPFPARQILAHRPEKMLSSQIRATVALHDPDNTDVYRLFEAAQSFGIAKAMRRIGRYITDRPFRSLTRRMALLGSQANLERLGEMVSLCEKTGVLPDRVLLREQHAPWIEQFPTLAHADLALLAGQSSQAFSIATRIAEDLLPHSDAIEMELKGIDQKLGVTMESHLRARLFQRAKNLQARIDSLFAPSQSEIRRFARSIRNQVELALVERVTTICQSQLTHWIFAERPGDLDLTPLFRPPYAAIRVLQGIFRLRGKSRELGCSILARYLQDPLQDFRHLPANSTFLKRIQAQGIDVTPWLDSDLTTRMTDGAGRAYTLAFTRDLLDVLWMGEHFDTCLASDGINFFSTLTNSIDINKRVLYARADSGEIVGRCLFALSDRGTILTYRRYAHRDAYRFSMAVDTFANQLAQRMGTTVSEFGHVPRLVGPRWYDDRPVQGVTRRYDATMVATLLGEATHCQDERLVDRLLHRAGGEHELLAILPQMIRDSNESHAGASRCLAGYFGLNREVSLDTRAKLAVWAYQSHHADIAARIVHSILTRESLDSVVRYILEFGIWPKPGDMAVFFRICSDQNATAVLRLLRRTRPYGIKEDLQEWEPVRRQALSYAHSLLGRVRLAAQLAALPSDDQIFQRNW